LIELNVHRKQAGDEAVAAGDVISPAVGRLMIRELSGE